MTSKDLRAKRAALIKQARDILDIAEKEKRDLNGEEQAQWDKLHADADKIKADYERLERQDQADLELASSTGVVAGGKSTDSQTTPEERAKEQHEVFKRWLVYGMGGLTPEQRQIMANRQSDIPEEARAQAVGVDTAGGYLVADGFIPRVETAMKAFAGLRRTRATVLTTDSGNTIFVPTSDDTSNSGELVAENTTVTEQDITFGSKALNAYMFSSKLVRVSIQFLQDVGINGIEAWLAERLGERIGRATATYNLTGTGSNQPEGIANVATEGVVGASATKITYDNLVDLEHSVDPAYRARAEFLLGDGALRAIKKLKDGEGKPLWVSGVSVKEPDRILGYPYAIDQGIPTPASSAKTIYFGDFSKFYLRDVRQMQMLRLVERYAEYLQVAFLLFMRHDSKLIDAGTHPIKYFQQGA